MELRSQQSAIPGGEHLGLSARDALFAACNPQGVVFRLLGACRPAISRRPCTPQPQRQCKPDRMSQTSLSSLIWSVADLLRGDYKPHEYGRVILPFTVLRRLDRVLESTKAEVLRLANGLKA